MAQLNNKRNFRGAGKDTYVIVGDGETEVWYFQMMKDHERLPRIDIKPELPKKKNLNEQYKAVVEYAQIYSKVIWLLDFDTLLKEDRERRKGGKSIIKLFEEYVEDLSKRKNVHVLVNTPCLEFWLLLHFKDTGKFYEACGAAEKQLKDSYLKDYEKSEKYYKNRNNNLYLKLKEKQGVAISNAKKRGDFDFQNTHSAKAELFKVFELLGID